MSYSNFESKPGGLSVNLVEKLDLERLLKELKPFKDLSEAPARGLNITKGNIVDELQDIIKSNEELKSALKKTWIIANQAIQKHIASIDQFEILKKSWEVQKATFGDRQIPVQRVGSINTG